MPQVARIQAELAPSTRRWAPAAEAYNGAVYELGQVQTRIAENRRSIVETEKDLVTTRTMLAERLRDLYETPEPSLAEVLITSGSISAAADKLDLLDRVGQQDADVVEGLRDSRKRLGELRAAAPGRRARPPRTPSPPSRRRSRRSRGCCASARRCWTASRASSAQLAQGRAGAPAPRGRRRRRWSPASARPRPWPPSSGGASVVGRPPRRPQRDPLRPAAERQRQRRRRGRGHAVSGRPLRLGRREPLGLRLQRPRLVRLRPDRQERAALHRSDLQRVPQVPAGQEQVGDLVFFNGLGHMGIYIGGGQFVHAPHTGDVVRVANLGDRGDYVGAVRP